MSRSGPPPKPTALLKLRGSDHARRILEAANAAATDAMLARFLMEKPPPPEDRLYYRRQWEQAQEPLPPEDLPAETPLPETPAPVSPLLD